MSDNADEKEIVPEVPTAEVIEAIPKEGVPEPNAQDPQEANPFTPPTPVEVISLGHIELGFVPTEGEFICRANMGIFADLPVNKQLALRWNALNALADYTQQAMAQMVRDKGAIMRLHGIIK